LHRYKYDARTVPSQWTQEGWAFKIRDFWQSLPFMHGDPKRMHVVYDDPNDLRVIDLEFSRLHCGAPFARGQPDAEWEYMLEHTAQKDANGLLLCLMGAPDSIIDAYDEYAHIRANATQIERIAWENVQTTHTF